MTDGYSLADIAAATGNNRNDGMFGGDWIWIIVLFLFAGGNGFGGFGNNGANGAGIQGLATRADINEGFAFNTLNNGIDALKTGQCTGFNGVNQNINNLGYQLQQCCCETNRNIDSVNYNMAKNTCDIIQAGNANTQRIVDMFTQDKIESLRTELNAAQLTLAQQAQTNTLLDQLKPCPSPAYVVPSPYASMYGCGCNSGCGC